MSSPFGTQAEGLAHRCNARHRPAAKQLATAGHCASALTRNVTLQLALRSQWLGDGIRSKQYCGTHVDQVFFCADNRLPVIRCFFTLHCQHLTIRGDLYGKIAALAHKPLIDKSICWSLLSGGLLLMFVIHPYVGIVLWVLALVIAVQELFLFAALPFIALWALLTRKW